MKKLFFAVAVVFLFVNISYSQEIKQHLKKENAFGLKLGGHIYNSRDDFIDFWEIKTSDMRDFVFELAYEKKIMQMLYLEIPIGYFDSELTDNDVILDGDTSKLGVLNLYFSPTIKCNLGVNDRFAFYFGGGPDLYYTEIDYKNHGKEDLLNYSMDDRFITFGVHGVVGMEIYIMKDPVSHGFYDLPVSLIFEYKYSWVEIKDADEKVVNYLNDLSNENNLGFHLRKHDIDVGAHKFFAGIKWHF